MPKRTQLTSSLSSLGQDSNTDLPSTSHFLHSDNAVAFPVGRKAMKYIQYPITQTTSPQRCEFKDMTDMFLNMFSASWYIPSDITKIYNILKKGQLDKWSCRNSC